VQEVHREDGLPAGSGTFPGGTDRRGSITQPLQSFPLTYGWSSYLLAAGRIGITALVAMGKAIKARVASYRFVYKARCRNLMAFAND
jgi:vanillate O-demethylase ferredoxin subunit